MKKINLLMPEDVVNIILLLDNQEDFAPYELRLRKSLLNWLKNYDRRKYS